MDSAIYLLYVSAYCPWHYGITRTNVLQALFYYIINYGLYVSICCSHCSANKTSPFEPKHNTYIHFIISLLNTL